MRTTLVIIFVAVFATFVESFESIDRQDDLPDGITADFIIEDISLSSWVKGLEEWSSKIFDNVKNGISHATSSIKNLAKDAVKLVSSIGGRVESSLKSLSEKIKEFEEGPVKNSLQNIKTKLQNFSSEATSKLQSAVAATENTITNFAEHVETKITDASIDIKDKLKDLVEKLKAASKECRAKYQPDIEKLKTNSIERAEKCAVEAKDSVVEIYDNRIQSLVLEVPKAVEKVVESSKTCIKNVDPSDSKLSCLTQAAVEAGEHANEIVNKVVSLPEDLKNDVLKAMEPLAVCVAAGLASTTFQAGKVAVDLVACIV